jgi:Homeodomain-like domain
MTPDDEATFIQLWQEGASYKAIAQALGCPLGTVASRSAALAAQGKIVPRPRGGAKVRLGDPPAPHPHPRPNPRAPAPLGPSSSGPCGCHSRSSRR